MDLQSPVDRIWLCLLESKPCIPSVPCPYEVSGILVACMGVDTGLQRVWCSYRSERGLYVGKEVVRITRQRWEDTENGGKRRLRHAPLAFHV